MSQGHLFTWLDGTEYQDVMGAWDWYLIPGSTVLYHYPTINSSWVGQKGVKNFVGVISDGTNGFSVMDYLDPHDGSISYRRAWFCIGDTVVNTIVNATRHSGSAPIVTVIDQRLSTNGSLALEGSTASAGNATASTMRYGNNGYFTFGTPFALTTTDGARTRDWSKLGTSSVTTNTQNIFLAYHTIPQGGSFSYAHLPAASAETLASEATDSSVRPLNTTNVTGITGRNYIGLVFWPDAATSVEVTSDWSTTPINISTSAPVIVLASKSETTITVAVADPTQTLQSLSVTFAGPQFSCGTAGGCKAVSGGVQLDLTLPSGGYAGNSVTATIALS